MQFSGAIASSSAFSELISKICVLRLSPYFLATARQPVINSLLNLTASFKIASIRAISAYKSVFSCFNFSISKCAKRLNFISNTACAWSSSNMKFFINAVFASVTELACLIAAITSSILAKQINKPSII